MVLSCIVSGLGAQGCGGPQAPAQSTPALGAASATPVATAEPVHTATTQPSASEAVRPSGPSTDLTQCSGEFCPDFDASTPVVDGSVSFDLIGDSFGAGGRYSSPDTRDGGSRWPSVREGSSSASGGDAEEMGFVRRIIRQNYGRFRLCYEKGLRQNPRLKGSVRVKFTIDRSGAVSSAENAGSTFPDPKVVECVAHGFEPMSFPQPSSGPTVVTYEILLDPPSR